MNNIVAFTPRAELPHNVEAEQALLGAALINNAGLDAINTPLLPEHFHEPAHGRIWQAIQVVRSQGRIANPTTLRQHFESDESLSAVGGADYLKRLTAAAVSVHDVAINDYADLIRDLSERRDLIRVCQTAVHHAHALQPGESAETVAETLQADVMRAVGRSSRPQTSIKAIAQDVLEQAERAMKAGKPVLGVPTMLSDLDRKLGGLSAGELIILAGRPGMGKSSLAGHLSIAASRNGVRTGVFSLEMPAADWARRAIASRMNVPYDVIRRGQLEPNKFVQFHDLADKLGDLPMVVDDTPALTLEAIRARATRLKASGGLGLLIIDYMGLIKPDNRYQGNKVAEIGQISSGLKALAKSLDVPVVALSQLNRANESRDDKRPGLSDLRQSGDIEQDADVVMFVYRDEYYLERKEPGEPNSPEYRAWLAKMDAVRNVTEIIVAKNRQGSVGTVRVFGDMATSRYADLARDPA